MRDVLTYNRGGEGGEGYLKEAVEGVEGAGSNSYERGV